MERKSLISTPIMEPNDPHGGPPPTAAVGSHSPVLGASRVAESRCNPTFSMEQVMSLLTSVTKQAAASAVTAAISTTPAPRDRGNFYLPPFDPDLRSHDIRDWCANVDETITSLNISPQEARMKAILQLKGRAKTWADTWSLQSTTWQQVKEDLIRTFGKEFRYADDVQKWRSFTSDQASSYAEYATTGWTLFKRVRPEASDPEVIDALLTGIYPEHIRSELLRNTPDSLPKLVSVLKTYRKRKLDSSEKPNNSNIKRSRAFDHSLTCYKCNKPGHRFRDCKEPPVPSSSSLLPKPNTYQSPDFRNASVKSVECKYCHKMGHVEKNCFRKQNNERHNSSQNKSINFCNNVNRSTTKVKIGNNFYECLFDTGADCSLIRQRFSGSIPGRRKTVNVLFSGIGGCPVRSSQSITTIVEIDGVNVELEFYVVGDTQTQFDILIGYDLLQIPGLSVTLTSSGISVQQDSNNIVKTINECITSGSISDIDTDLTDQTLLEQLKNIVNNYKQSFTTGNNVSVVNTGELEIKLKNPDKIVQRRPFRLSPVEREKVKSIISDLKSNGIIRESSSPFSSPILLVKKKDGSDRLCVDFRELNANTLRDHYPLPLIADQIDKLGKARYFTCLDMAAGFYQIPIAANSIGKTGFVTPDGQYEFLRMPFGLCNAPSVYQRAINKALGDYKDKIALVYIDDILIFSQTPEEGLQNLNLVLNRLTVAGFSLNIAKCSFLKKSVQFLGNVVENGTVKPSPLKIQALSNSPIPRNVKELRQFNGLASYFRKFVPNFSKIMVPLYELTKSNVKWNWTEAQDRARQEIISRLTSSPLLTIFDPDLPTELHTDASALGYGAVLIQRHNQVPHVIGYFSMRTTSAESKYHSYELETLAVVKAIKHFRHFLYGRSFKVITDCNSLKASRHKKELTPRVHRWWSYLQSFQFEIEYRKGERLAHADYFSRNPIDMPRPRNDLSYNAPSPDQTLHFSVNSSNLDHNWLLIEQKRDPELSDIVKKLQSDCIPKNLADTYVILQDKLLRRKVQIDKKTRKLIFVPRSYRWNLISHYHSSLQHFSWEKVLAKIREQYWFPNMSKLVRKFIENCVSCRVRKGVSGARQVSLHPIDKNSVPFHTVHADITGQMNGKRNRPEYAFVYIDAFTKYVHLVYSNDRTSDSAIRCFREVITIFGTPTRLITDQDKSMTSLDFKQFCKNFGIEHHVVAKGASRANGQVERVMKVIKDNMSVVELDKPWHNSIQDLQLAINCTKSKSTGKSPMELLFGKKCSPPAIKLLQVDDDEPVEDLIAVRNACKERMDERSIQDKIRFDKGKAKIKPFQVGDFVLMRIHERHTTKLGPKFEGPMEILAILPNDRYKLKHVNLRGCSEKIASHDYLRPAPVGQADPFDDSDNECTIWADDVVDKSLKNNLG